MRDRENERVTERVENERVRDRVDKDREREGDRQERLTD